jgi:ABC-type dipeptide/oligopeptide/nickel transport system permease component
MEGHLFNGFFSLRKGSIMNSLEVVILETVLAALCGCLLGMIAAAYSWSSATLLVVSAVIYISYETIKFFWPKYYPIEC